MKKKRKRKRTLVGSSNTEKNYNRPQSMMIEARLAREARNKNTEAHIALLRTFPL